MTIITLGLDPICSERIYIPAITIPCHLMFLLNTVWELPETADTVPYLSKSRLIIKSKENKLKAIFIINIKY